MTEVTRSGDLVHRVVTTKKDKTWEINKWCEQQFGKRWSVVDNRAGVWVCFWRGFKSPGPGHYEWLFKHERDAVLFALKWL